MQCSVHEGRVSKRLNTEFASSCSCTDYKYIQNYVKTRLAECPRKTVGYVLSESKQFERNRMCIFIVDALSLKVTAPDLSAIGTLMLIQENERKSLTALD